VINAIYTQTPSRFGMPASARVRTAWTRALPVQGEAAFAAMGTGVTVQGTGVSTHRIAADGTLPGTSVWRPPN
jgi:hypothetical protein